MGYSYRTDEPVPNTCPLIDDVINFIDNNVEEEEGITQGDKIMGRCEKTNIIKVLEQIREANSTLRAWGNEHHRAAYDFESEKDELQKEVDRLTREVEELRSENKDLENRVASLESDIDSLEDDNNDLRSRITG